VVGSGGSEQPAGTEALVLTVPARGLVLLVGASGSGKSTFAARHFARTEILSSDAFRALVGDDEADQTATAAAFDVLMRVLGHRLRRGRLSVVDATNARSDDRRRLLLLAASARRPTAAIVFDLPEAVSQARNRGREGRSVSPDVVARQAEHVRRSVADPAAMLAEGLSVLHILDSPAAADRVQVVRDGAMPRATAAERSPRPRERRARSP
jgi:predicted kinase